MVQYIERNQRRIAMQDLIRETQDLRNLVWSLSKNSPGTPGCFLKAYDETDGMKLYYKMSNYDSYRGVFGHECINELIVSRLLDIIGIEHVQYILVHANINVDGKDINTYISKSQNFRLPGESKIAFDQYYELHRKEGESPLDFSVRMGFGLFVYQMLVVDYLICNRDRHGANVELLVDKKGTVRPAPLFDHGCSLLFSCYDDIEYVRKFDVMQDRPTNNFIGSRSPEYNLSLVPRDELIIPRKLQREDEAVLLDGLDGILPKEHLDKIWQMIWGRWQRYAEICHS